MHTRHGADSHSSNFNHHFNYSYLFFHLLKWYRHVYSEPKGGGKRGCFMFNLLCRKTNVTRTHFKYEFFSNLLNPMCHREKVCPSERPCKPIMPPLYFVFLSVDSTACHVEKEWTCHPLGSPLPSVRQGIEFSMKTFRIRIA